MGLISIGDMAHNFLLRRQVSVMKQAAQTAGTELATGRTADPARHMRGDLMRLSSIETSLTRLGAYQASANDAAMTARNMQQILANVAQITQGIDAGLLNAGTISEAGTLNALLQDADQRFQSTITSLNTRLGEGTLLAGTKSDGPALAGAETLLLALEAAIAGAGATTADAIETTVAAWFADSAGFAAVGYLGGAPVTSQAVSADDRVDLGFTALDPAIVNTLKSLSMAALLHRGTITGLPEVKSDLARRAGEQLLQSQSDRAVMAGRIGIAEARIDEASSRNAAETAALQQFQADLLGIDPYEAAARMEASRNQLETLYAITARLSRLSMVDFLR